MNEHFDDELAFPVSEGTVIPIGYSDMALRDYFAAKAMQGWLTNPVPDDTLTNEVAEWSYRMADAMLKAREA